jgi:hypothetical protein
MQRDTIWHSNVDLMSTSISSLKLLTKNYNVRLPPPPPIACYLFRVSWVHILVYVFLSDREIKIFYKKSIQNNSNSPYKSTKQSGILDVTSSASVRRGTARASTRAHTHTHTHARTNSLKISLMIIQLSTSFGAFRCWGKCVHTQ